MRAKLIILLVSFFFIINIYYDCKYTHIFKNCKKYYQIGIVAFAGISLYAYIKKNPENSYGLLEHANQAIKYLPIDKNSKDMITPLFGMMGKSQSTDTQISRIIKSGNNSDYSGSGGSNGAGGGIGSNGAGDGISITKRSVSETKKKFVAASQGWKCRSCNNMLPAWFEVDHTTRLDQGGTNSVDNLVALCRDCHGKKTAMENL